MSKKNEDLFSQDYSFWIDFQQTKIIFGLMESIVIEVPDASPHEGAPERYPFRVSETRENVWFAICRRHLTPEKGVTKCLRFHLIEGYKTLFTNLLLLALSTMVAWLFYTRNEKPR